MLTANEIYSVMSSDFDGFWVTVDFQGKTFKCEGFMRCEDESSEEMRDAGYVQTENGYEYGRELWIEASEIQTE